MQLSVFTSADSQRLRVLQRGTPPRLKWRAFSAIGVRSKVRRVLALCPSAITRGKGGAAALCVRDPESPSLPWVSFVAKFVHQVLLADREIHGDRVLVREDLLRDEGEALLEALEVHAGLEPAHAREDRPC